MKQPRSLTELIQEHFDGVLHSIDGGRWGNWMLDREHASHGQLLLTHQRAGYTVALSVPGDWVARVAEKEWATADDVGQLVFAIRDLEYARWLGVLPENTEQAYTAVDAIALDGTVTR